MLTFTKEELETILASLNNNFGELEISSKLKEKVEYMIKECEQKIETELQKRTLCSSCDGDGEYEVSAGSHSFFKECECCNGTGKNLKNKLEK